jgi:hypothetical protein
MEINNMKIWKKKDCFYSDIIKELNNLEKKHAVVREITSSNENWFTIFYTIEDDNIEE